MKRSACVIAVCVWFISIQANLIAQDWDFVVVGFDSDTVVAFDIDSNQSQVLVQFPRRFAPRGIAINDLGEIFIGLRLETRNVIKLIDDGNGGIVWRNFSAHSIGDFGPGKIKFGANGNLFVAAGSDGAVKELDGIIGSQVGVFNIPGGSGALQGLAISGTDIYASEYFQNRIQLFDGSSYPIMGDVLVDDDVNMARPAGMAVGPDDSLIVVNSLNPFVQQYDADGNFMGTLFDLGVVDQKGGWDVVYDHRTNSYFVSTRSDSVYQISPQGELLKTFTSPQLAGAYGIAFIEIAQRIIPVDLFEMKRGIHVSGTVADLVESDNSDLSLQRNGADIQSSVIVEFKGSSPTDTPPSLSIQVEASVFARSVVNQSIDLYDHVSNSWVEVDSRIANPNTDVVVTAEATGNLNRFVHPEDWTLTARCRFQSVNPRQRFAANVDDARWLIGQ